MGVNEQRYFSENCLNDTHKIILYIFTFGNREKLPIVYGHKCILLACTQIAKIKHKKRNGQLFSICVLCKPIMFQRQKSACHMPNTTSETYTENRLSMRKLLK